MREFIESLGWTYTVIHVDLGRLATFLRTSDTAHKGMVWVGKDGHVTHYATPLKKRTRIRGTNGE